MAITGIDPFKPKETIAPRPVDEEELKRILAAIEQLGEATNPEPPPPPSPEPQQAKPNLLEWIFRNLSLGEPGVIIPEAPKPSPEPYTGGGGIKITPEKLTFPLGKTVDAGGKLVDQPLIPMAQTQAKTIAEDRQVRLVAKELGIPVSELEALLSTDPKARAMVEQGAQDVRGSLEEKLIRGVEPLLPRREPGGAEKFLRGAGDVVGAVTEPLSVTGGLGTLAARSLLQPREGYGIRQFLQAGQGARERYGVEEGEAPLDVLRKVGLGAYDKESIPFITGIMAGLPLGPLGRLPGIARGIPGAARGISSILEKILAKQAPAAVKGAQAGVEQAATQVAEVIPAAKQALGEVPEQLTKLRGPFRIADVASKPTRVKKLSAIREMPYVLPAVEQAGGKYTLRYTGQSFAEAPPGYDIAFIGKKGYYVRRGLEKIVGVGKVKQFTGPLMDMIAKGKKLPPMDVAVDLFKKGIKPIAGGASSFGPIRDAEIAITKQSTLAKGMNLVGKAPAVVNALLVPLVATLDLTFWGIQGLLATARHPQMSAKAMGIALKAARDPRVIDEYLVKNLTATTSGQKHGLRIISTDPGYELLFPHFATKVPGIGRVFTAGNDMFSGYGDVLRVEMYKSLSKGVTHPRELLKLSEFINNFTGTTAMDLPGWAQQAAFAPRFFISQLKMLGNTVRGGKVGKETREAFASLLGLAATTTHVINEQRGYKTSFDPKDPNFMRMRNIAGQDVSLLGPWDAWFRFAGIAAKDGIPEATAYMARSKLSPFYSIINDVVLQGQTFTGERTDQWKDGDWLGFFGGLARAHTVPFAAGNLDESLIRAGSDPVTIAKKIGTGESLTDKEMEAIAGAGITLVLPKSAPLSLTDRRNEWIKDNATKLNLTGKEGKPIQSWDELGPKDRFQLLANNPELARLEKIFKDRAVPTISETYRRKARQQYEYQIDRDQWVQEGHDTKGKTYSMDDWMDDKRSRYTLLKGMGELRTSDPQFARAMKRLQGSADKYDQALAGYYQKFDEFTVSGHLDDAVYDDIDAYLEKLPIDERQWIERNTGTQRTDFEEQVLQWRKIVEPYFDIADTIASQKPEWRQALDTKDRAKVASTEEARLNAFLTGTGYTKAVEDAKEAYRIQHPEVDATLGKLQDAIPYGQQIERAKARLAEYEKLAAQGFNVRDAITAAKRSIRALSEIIAEQGKSPPPETPSPNTPFLNELRQSVTPTPTPEQKILDLLGSPR